MAKINELIEKVGIDKIAHFAVGAWIVAEFKQYGVGFGFIGFLVVVALSIAKEKIDKKITTMDLWWSVCGGCASLALMVLSQMILKCLKG